jgi:hypothetical protein
MNRTSWTRAVGQLLQRRCFELYASSAAAAWISQLPAMALVLGIAAVLSLPAAESAAAPQAQRRA